MDDIDPALDLIRTSIPDGKPIWTENTRGCTTRMRWNGEVGYGWLERTRRLGAL